MQKVLKHLKRTELCHTLALLVCLTILLVACKGNKGNAESATPQPAVASTVPAAPAKPVPSFSAAEKIGVFVFPKNNQSKDQQLIDELDCYDSVAQQTGINPEGPPPSGPSAAQVQAAEQSAADQAEQQKGGRARGAARGAAGGAVLGAIGGNAGAGAAAGAAVGTVRGGRKQREANAAAKDQAAQNANAQLQGQYGQAKAAYNQKQSTFKRGFSACMDARNYSVK